MPFNNSATCSLLRYDFRQRTIDAFAEVGPKRTETPYAHMVASAQKSCASM